VLVIVMRSKKSQNMVVVMVIRWRIVLGEAGHVECTVPQALSRHMCRCHVKSQVAGVGNVRRKLQVQQSAITKRDGESCAMVCESG